jgi:hypothetical protein
MYLHLGPPARRRHRQSPYSRHPRVRDTTVLLRARRGLSAGGGGMPRASRGRRLRLRALQGWNRQRLFSDAFCLRQRRRTRGSTPPPHPKFIRGRFTARGSAFPYANACPRIALSASWRGVQPMLRGGSCLLFATPRRIAARAARRWRAQGRRRQSPICASHHLRAREPRRRGRIPGFRGGALPRFGPTARRAPRRGRRRCSVTWT